MRHGFITVHLSVGTKFNFQKYILRTLEDDFKVVVGISPTLWTSAVIFLLLNVKGLHTLFWIAVIPLFIILAVGTKLQATITKMALEIKERHVVIQGIPLVQLSDDHFWFGRPQFLLFLIHLALFQNAFQIIYFLWISYEFGLDSCFNDSIELVAIRICLGIGVQFLCSYVTLPLYALVSQMGSNMKTSIFDEQASKAVQRRRSEAANKKNAGAASTSSSTGGNQKARENPRHGGSSKSSGDSRNIPSQRRPKMEQDASDVPAEVQLSAAVSAAAPVDLLAGTSQQSMRVMDLLNYKEDEFKLINLRGP